MANVDLKRIIEDTKKCEKEVKIKEVTDIFLTSMSFLYNKGTIMKRVEKAIGEQDYNTLITSITGTFLSNLYANTALNLHDALIYGKNINAKAAVLSKRKK